jgi:outer membrane protein TolC
MTVSACAAFLAAALLQLPAWAQASDAMMESTELSLEQVLRIALENNLDLVSAGYAPKLAEQDISTQQSNFDSVFQAQYTHVENENPPVQASSVTGFKRDQLNLLTEQQLKFGGSYRVQFDSRKDLTQGPLVLAPESFVSFLGFSFQLPILRGFGTEVTSEQLLVARNDLDVSFSDFEVRVEQTLEQVEGAYWDVVAAREGLRIERLQLTRNQDLLELNRKKVEVGTLAPIEITQAEAGVASQEEAVIVAEVSLRDAEDELRRLMAIPADDPMWEMAIANATRPVFEPREIDLDAEIETALENRSEMASREQTVLSRELSERAAKRRTRAQLDLTGQYTPQGSSLTILNQQMVVLQQGTTGESIENITKATQDNWNAQLTYRIPIGNRAAKADYARARLLREQSEVDLDNQQQTIRVEVRSAVRGVTSGIKRVEAARVNVRLQQKKLEAEQKKFENGMSTSFEVLTFQNDLADAERAEIQARLDYIKSLAALERAKGTLLESRGLTLARPGADRS